MTITVTADQRAALSLVVVSPDDWLENLRSTWERWEAEAIAAKMDEAKALAATADIAAIPALIEAGAVKTAAALAAEREAAASPVQGVTLPLPDISDRQFFQALATEPYAAVTGVTMAEAKAAVKVGQLPAALQSVVDAIADGEERDRADMLLSGATVFQRAHPEVARFAAAMGWSDEEVNAFWRFASTL